MDVSHIVAHFVDSSTHFQHPECLIGACAGPYGQRLLGIETSLAREYEQELLKRNELIRPGFCRVGIPFFSSEEEIQFVIDAVAFVAEHGWKFLPEYGYHSESGEWRYKCSLSLDISRFDSYYYFYCHGIVGIEL